MSPVRMISPSDGSSPHTRGLQNACQRRQRPRGIIPAHAGFTAPSSAERRWSGGSSPHTRGLPGPVPPALAGARIIPAHAGFTRRCAGISPPARDHPRTRGVYVINKLSGLGTQGSSPHTRGLQEPDAPPGGGPVDHPRTRGVYANWVSGTVTGIGSSPHTRGLLISDPLGAVENRIIPAHAGFTRRSTPTTGRPPDHPRTRGVY